MLLLTPFGVILTFAPKRNLWEWRTGFYPTSFGLLAILKTFLKKWAVFRAPPPPHQTVQLGGFSKGEYPPFYTGV